MSEPVPMFCPSCHKKQDIPESFGTEGPRHARFMLWALCERGDQCALTKAVAADLAEKAPVFG